MAEVGRDLPRWPAPRLAAPRGLLVRVRVRARVRVRVRCLPAPPAPPLIS